MELYERRLSFVTWALRVIFDPRPLISFALYRILYCTLTKSPDLVRHVGTCSNVVGSYCLIAKETVADLIQSTAPISFPEEREPRCKNTNAPRLRLSYVNKCGCSCVACVHSGSWILSSSCFLGTQANYLKLQDPSLVKRNSLLNSELPWYRRA